MASLIVIEGPNKGRYFALEDHRLVSVGRDDQCTFQILDDQISRRHLQVRLERSDRRHYAADHRSANGVFVNEARVVSDVALSDNDRIRLGTTTLVYTTSDFADAATAMDAVRKKDEWKRSTLADPEE